MCLATSNGNMSWLRKKGFIFSCIVKSRGGELLKDASGSYTLLSTVWLAFTLLWFCCLKKSQTRCFIRVSRSCFRQKGLRGRSAEFVLLLGMGNSFSKTCYESKLALLATRQANKKEMRCLRWIRWQTKVSNDHLAKLKSQMTILPSLDARIFHRSEMGVGEETKRPLILQISPRMASSGAVYVLISSFLPSTGGQGSEQRHFNSKAEKQDSVKQAIMYD